MTNKLLLCPFCYDTTVQEHCGKAHKCGVNYRKRFNTKKLFEKYGKLEWIDIRDLNPKQVKKFCDMLLHYYRKKYVVIENPFNTYEYLEDNAFVMMREQLKNKMVKAVIDNLRKDEFEKWFEIPIPAIVNKIITAYTVNCEKIPEIDMLLKKLDFYVKAKGYGIKVINTYA